MSRKNILLVILVAVCAIGVFFVVKSSYFFQSDTRNDDPAGSENSPASEQNSFVVTTGADFGANIHTDKVLAKIKNINPSFHLTLGDMSYDEIVGEKKWCEYINRSLDGKIPFQLISGNHESDGADGLIDRFAECLPNRIKTIVGTYGKEYYFDYPETKPYVRFILISPELRFTDGITYHYVPGNIHLNWLNEAIDSARTNDIPWVVVGMHKDCIHPGQAECAMGIQLMNYLIQKKVNLVLQAHAHIYMRMKQLTCIVSNPRGILFDDACVVKNSLGNIYKKESGATFITIGSVGKEVRLVDKSSDSYKYVEKAMYRDTDATYGLLKLDFSRQQIRGEFVPTEGGIFKDTFVIKP